MATRRKSSPIACCMKGDRGGTHQGANAYRYVGKCPEMLAFLFLTVAVFTSVPTERLRRFYFMPYCSSARSSERILGVPTVSDRIAQVVVKQLIEKEMESIFLPDSYGYRPQKSALDAVGVTRERCWKYDWVLGSISRVCPTTSTTCCFLRLFGNPALWSFRRNEPPTAPAARIARLAGQATDEAWVSWTGLVDTG
jgi:hypothetical protein